jgi:4-hydroxybenzoate polyprenyltransferase
VTALGRLFARAGTTTTAARVDTQSVRSPAQGHRSFIVRECRLTSRMLADNILLCLLPTVMFALGAAAYTRASILALATGVGKAALLSVLFAYVFDSSNQARGAEEDRRNKPYRPIPAGLTDERGLMLRFAAAMPVYTLAGWLLGALPWVLLFQLSIIAQLLWASPRYYIWWKTPATISGSITQLATGWSVVAALDSTAWTWIVTISIYLPITCVYEDVRDTEGDHAVGRRTAPLVFGPTPIRWWFALLALLLPLVVYVLLVHPARAALWRELLTLGPITILAWWCAARALAYRNTRADRLTYQLFTLTWAMCLAAAPLLWW